MHLPTWRPSTTLIRLAALLHGLALLLLAPVALAQSTYYVAPGGSNSNSCTTAKTNAVASAKATMNGSSGAIACLAPGDTLVLKDGVYAEQLADSASSEHLGTTRPPSGASWERPTVIKAEHIGRATLTLPPGGNHVVSFGLADTRYIVVEGLVLDAGGHGACVWIGPASPIRMRYNHVKRCGGNGLYVDTTVGVELIANVIEDVALQQTGPPGSHAVYFVGSQGLIKGNVIRGQCPYFGIHSTSELGGIHDNTIEQNIVVGCRQAGIVSQGARTLIRNNQLHRNGIGLQCQGSREQQWYGNSIVGYQVTEYNPDTYGILDLTDGCDWRNNLVLEQKVTSWHSYIYATRGTPHLEANLCDNPGERCQHLVEPGTVVVRNAAAGDFRLPPGSPAIDKGVALPDALPTDWVGRAQAPAWDIGALAYAQAAPQPPDPPDPPQPQPGPHPVLVCTGTLSAVPGPMQMTCTPQAGGRR